MGDSGRDGVQKLERALEHICSDTLHLNQNPQMLDRCCPRDISPLPHDASDTQVKAREKLLTTCYDARYMPANKLSDPVSEQAQRFVEEVFGKLCVNPVFNQLEPDLCCRVDRQTGQNVGLAGDNPDVARTCALLR